jgi:hypothetical protein
MRQEINYIHTYICIYIILMNKSYRDPIHCFSHLHVPDEELFVSVSEAERSFENLKNSLFPCSGKRQQ